MNKTLRNKEMCKTKTSMRFLCSQPIIGCPLLTSKFLKMFTRCSKKVSTIKVPVISREVFLRKFDRDSADSLKYVRYYQACPL